MNLCIVENGKQDICSIYQFNRHGLQDDWTRNTMLLSAQVIWKTNAIFVY